MSPLGELDRIARSLHPGALRPMIQLCVSGRSEEARAAREVGLLLTKGSFITPRDIAREACRLLRAEGLTIADLHIAEVRGEYIVRYRDYQLLRIIPHPTL